jgi:hypothetical protein
MIWERSVTPSSSLALNASITPGTATRLQSGDECCPTCDQPIPRDRAEEIIARISSRQQAHETTVTARLRREFARETASAVEAAKQEGVAALEREREQGAARVAAAQEQARNDAQRALQESESATAERVAGMQRAQEQEKSSADARISALQDQLNKTRDDADANEARIRTEERETAAAAANEQIANVERERQVSEAELLSRIAESQAAKTTAQEANAALQVRLDQVQHDQVDRETCARAEGAATAAAAMRVEVERAQTGKAAAEASAAAFQAERQTLTEQLTAAKGELQIQKDAHDTAIARAVQETRETLEITTAATIGAAKAEAHKEKQKVVDELAEVQRKLEKKTADELGEGAEVNLIEALKDIFDGDKIDPVGKGNPGADIIHTVIHNGIECGKIIYDSKDHGQWRWDFVTKLASDKIAAKADHAILSIRKFPQGTQQLYIHDGVVLANPARVVALVQLIREHVIQAHTLRLSNEEKAKKSVELYSFVTSAQFTDLLDRIDVQAQELQALQDDERKAHENLWKKQSIRFRSIQKAGGDLSYRIEMIIGIAGDEATGNGS